MVQTYRQVFHEAFFRFALLRFDGSSRVCSDSCTKCLTMNYVDERGNAICYIKIICLVALSLKYKPTSVRQRRRPLYGYSPSAAYVRQRRRLQHGYSLTATYVRKWLLYISQAVSEWLSTVKYKVCEKMPLPNAPLWNFSYHFTPSLFTYVICAFPVPF